MNNSLDCMRESSLNLYKYSFIHSSLLFYILKFYVLVLHMFLPIYSKEIKEDYAQNEMLRLVHGDSERVDLNQFSELLSNIVFLWLEDSSPNFAVYFLTSLYNRITRKIVIRDGKQYIYVHALKIIKCLKWRKEGK